MTTGHINENASSSEDNVGNEQSPKAHVVQGSQPPPLIVGEPLEYQPARALIGWLSEVEAIRALLGREPGPNDDVSDLREQAAQKRAQVSSRSPYTPASAEVAATDQATLDRITARPEVQAQFGNMRWRVAMIDLSYVLSFQKIINLGALDERLAPVEKNPSQLIDFCLPVNQPVPPLGAFTDPDGKGFTISSLNPNLRIAGGMIQKVELSPAPGLPPISTQAVSIFVTMGASYLQVAFYNGRYFLRDGYHRAAGLVRAGMTIVPCIMIEADNFEQLAIPPGSLTYEVLFGEHPPIVADFWNNDVSADIRIPVVRKVIRVRGDEFVVQG